MIYTWWWLIQDENRRGEEREWMGDKYLLHHFYYAADNKNYKIWALTAGILIRTASTVYQRPPAFLERRPNFWNEVARSKIQRKFSKSCISFYSSYIRFKTNHFHWGIILFQDYLICDHLIISSYDLKICSNNLII